MLHSAHPHAVHPHCWPAVDLAEFSSWIGAAPAQFLASACARAVATIALAIVFAYPLAHLELHPFDLYRIETPRQKALPLWTEPVNIRVAGDHFELCQPGHRAQPAGRCCSHPVPVQLLAEGRVLPGLDGDFLDCMLHPSPDPPSRR